MRSFAIYGVALVVLVSPAFGQARGPGRKARAVARARIPLTLQRLNERIPEVSFEEAPFDQVMEWVGEFTETNVVVRWQTLEDAGIERDKPISIRVRNLRLSQVLWMIMNEAGGTDVKLAYRAAGNLLIMSTEDDLGEERILRVYDVSDLLIKIPRFRAPTMDLSAALQQAGQGGGGGGSGQSLFEEEEDDYGEEDEDADEASMTELVQLIVDTVEPDSWLDNGGLGTIRGYGRRLVVYNSILVHQKLAGFVEEGG